MSEQRTQEPLGKGISTPTEPVVDEEINPDGVEPADGTDPGADDESPDGKGIS
ncbi:MAG: hypothetical protein ACRDTM_09890 [Micromonosporaceae bacterium]